ncbi:aspartyl-phosphate phosphatase Spo0E family protein [Paenibacillus sp. 481]|uniref:aspartyl-phosphate phosphatase Spo0E family protein n=1 Tax=Paenibacillus sp. 481 TaxID=2835869 RepID=UPI001E63E098|nr:aspartyl-phosphate phosphatase Spo0E family protein [Paenibacillus sp. 481]UHA71774.1 aspartyl-phosphate phosphatase Spo0E family protein [Paenibacillus sp. 481]
MGNDYLLNEIQKLKDQLVRAVDEHHSLTNERVVQISQELDIYVLQFQKNVWARMNERGTLQ